MLTFCISCDTISVFPDEGHKNEEDENMKSWEATIEIMKEAYIKVMGQAKWDSLTDKEKHDAIMCMVLDAMKALEAK